MSLHRSLLTVHAPLSLSVLLMSAYAVASDGNAGETCHSDGPSVQSSEDILEVNSITLFSHMPRADLPITDSGSGETVTAQLRTERAANLVEDYIEATVADLAMADNVDIGALVDEYIPIAWVEAGEWIKRLDYSAVPLALVKPKYECQKQVGCEGADACAFDGYKELSYCVVTNCGSGECRTCPDIFNLDKLIVKGWCSYTCMVGGYIVGIKMRVLLALNGEISKCLKLEKPVPCEGTCSR